MTPRKPPTSREIADEKIVAEAGPWMAGFNGVLVKGGRSDGFDHDAAYAALARIANRITKKHGRKK